jgi:ketosteroid isomerase-like protein
MRGKYMLRLLSLLVIPLLILSSAFGQSDQNLRAEVEKMSAAHAENFNKQNAAGIAALYAKGATLVNAAGVQTSLEESFQNAFKLGFNRQEVSVAEVTSITPDIGIGIGEYTNSGQGQSGPLQVRGRWTAVYIRQDGVWKIRLLTAVPIPPPKQP